MTEAPERSRADTAESVFTWGVFAYVVVRALTVWQPLQDGQVNPYIFLALDLATAYPYAKSWPRLIRSIRGRRPDRIVFWAMVLLGSVLLPYAYVFIAGDDIATWVWYLFGAFLALAAVSAAVRLRQGLRGDDR
jgi:hypothetical protein